MNFRKSIAIDRWQMVASKVCGASQFPSEPVCTHAYKLSDQSSFQRSS